MEETVHVTFSEDDEAISQSSTKCLGNTEYFPYIPTYEKTTPSESPILQESIISEYRLEFTEADNHPALNEPDQTESSGLFIPARNSKIIEGIDYEETFAPIARLEAIRIFLAYAAYMGFMVYRMDVKSAFLNGKISKEVYVQQPSMFESSEYPNHVCKLDKALYGLKQAPKAWYETLSKFLIEHKFVRGTIENNLFTYKTKRDVIIVQIYVDDIIFGSTSSKLSKKFRKLMTKKYEMSMIGELTYFLGFQIKQDFKGIFIFQEKYVKDLLKKYDLADGALMKCHMLPPNNLGPDESGVSVNKTLFRGMIGSLMYLTASRPDI
ncbi:retrovirus-related pol polyprotein from transposon TNT 1-94 [Tanacetum coccineum]